MKIAHSAIATPHRCGLYETTRELVLAIRELGHDARIVDPCPQPKVGITVEDRGVPIADMDWAVKSDVIINHSGIDKTPLANSSQPIVHVAHGRPLSTFMGERSGSAPGLTWQTQKRNDPRYIGAVTFWPEYEPYLRTLWTPKPVYVVPPTVDLEYWKPGGSKFDFYKQKAPYNVIMTDPWSREDAQPYHCIHAFALFNRIIPSSKLHMFAWDGNKKAITGLKNLLGYGGGVITRWATNVRDIMRAADMLISPHRIYTRSIREAMACNLQVVSGRDVHPEDIERFALEMVRKREQPEPTRELAKALFSSSRSAQFVLNAVEAMLANGQLAREA